MKKVLIAKQNLEKTYSGATRTVHEQIKYFKAKGFEVHTVGEVTNVEDITKAGAISHKTFRWPWQKKFKRRLQFSKEAQKVAKNIQANLVIGHGDLQQQDVFLLHNCVHLAEEKINGKKLSSKHEMYQTHTPILQNQQFKQLIANSELMKKDLIERFKIPAEKISVIYPAVDPDQFKVLQNRDEMRAKLGVKQDEFLVGLITSGNFKKRGVDRFFNAINFLPAELAQKTHFVFVGKDKLSPEIQTILDNSPYQERIRLLPIIHNVEEYFNALDIFVLPARIEEFGRVVAEAMSCGSPIITTKWVGAAELLQDKSREFIYDGEDNQELANLIEKLLKNSKLRSEISKLNTEAAKQATEAEMFKRFDAVFNPLINSNT